MMKPRQSLMPILTSSRASTMVDFDTGRATMDDVDCGQGQDVARATVVDVDFGQVTVGEVERGHSRRGDVSGATDGDVDLGRGRDLAVAIVGHIHVAIF